MNQRMAQAVLAIVALPIRAPLSAIDPVPLQAVSTMGARPHTIFFRIMLPMSVPGMLIVRQVAGQPSGSMAIGDSASVAWSADQTLLFTE
jgi:ABC-type nitrate/sulfonate/bicarbonate transport system permease component